MSVLETALNVFSAIWSCYRGSEVFENMPQFPLGHRLLYDHAAAVDLPHYDEAVSSLL